MSSMHVVPLFVLQAFPGLLPWKGNVYYSITFALCLLLLGWGGPTVA
jgi:hypothetical protein